jgi:hypothetical protein
MDLALLAVVVSLISLVWSVYNTFWLQRPRLFAELSKSVRVTAPAIGLAVPRGEGASPTAGQPIEHLYIVTALNVGSEPATIWDVGLMDRRGTDITSVSNALANRGAVDGPSVPTRLEPHGALSWTFADALTNQFPPDQEIYGWVSRFRPLRKWRTSDGAARRRQWRATASHEAGRWSKKRQQRALKAYKRYRSSHGIVRVSYGYQEPSAELATADVPRGN